MTEFLEKMEKTRKKQEEEKADIWIQIIEKANQEETSFVEQFENNILRPTQNLLQNKKLVNFVKKSPNKPYSCVYLGIYYQLKKKYELSVSYLMQSCQKNVPIAYTLLGTISNEDTTYFDVMKNYLNNQN